MLQEYNPKNKDILVYVGDRLYKREEAKVSVFDRYCKSTHTYI